MLHRRSRARWLLFAIGGVLVAAVGVLAVLQLSAPSSTRSGAGSSGPCSPQPCLNLEGYTLWVSNVAESGGIVRMQVRFRNASNSTHAAPEDLALVDSAKQISPAIQDAPGCTHWERTEFNNGARYGPITLCFRPASLDPPLTLRWTPDMGFFCCEADLKLR